MVIRSIAWSLLAVSVFAAPARAQPCVPAPPDLAAWWDADGGGADRTGQNPATLHGVTLSAGLAGVAFGFDGDDFVTAPTAGFPVGSAPIGYDLWVLPLANGFDRRILEYGGYGNGTNFNLYLNYGVYRSDHWGAQYTDYAAARFGEWQHVALTSDGAEHRFYLDGVPAGSGQRPLALSDSGLVWLGRYAGGAGYDFAGYMDEVDVFARALGSEDAAAIHAAGASGKCELELAFVTATLPRMRAGRGFSTRVRVAYGHAPVTLAVTAGTLPPGLTLAADGLLAGTPEAAGTYGFTLGASDAGGATATRSFTAIVDPALACAALDPALAAWWDGDFVDPGIALDLARDNDAQLFGNATLVAGADGPAFTFDGAGDYLTAPAVGFPTGSASISYALWARPVADGFDRRLVEYGGYDNGTNFNLYLSGGAYRVDYWGAQYHDFAAVRFGEWQQVALTSNGARHRFHLDGALTHEGAHALRLVNGGAVQLGRYAGGGGYDYAGQLDAVRVYARELAPDEVHALYQVATVAACDDGPTDTDGDGVEDDEDACPAVNPGSRDADHDGCADTAAALAGEIASMGLPAGTSSALGSLASNAAASAAKGNKTAAANQLNALINKTTAFVRTGQLTSAQGALLLAFARNALAGL